MPGVVELAVLGLVFVGVVVGVLAAARRGEAYLRVQRRLHASGEAASPVFEASNIIKPQAVKNPILAWVQSATSLKDAADRDRISKLLFQAGFEHPAAPIWFVIARFGAAIGLPMVFLFTQASSEKPLNSTALAASHGDFSVKAVRRRPMFCIEGLDQRTAWVLPRVAGPNGVSQDPLHALQVGDPRSDVCQVRSSEGSHLGARGLSSTGKAQEGAHLV